MNQPTFCSELSEQSHEPLIGSATPTSTYLLLEYTQAWGPKAIPESTLPSQVKEWLSAQTQQISDSKALLIRGESKSQDSGISFFVTNAQEQGPEIYSFHLSQYEDLLELDLPALLDGDAYQTHLSSNSLFLVCTHGRKDACCAKSGLPVYRVLKDATAGDDTNQVWQVSHIGGHRFAANLICLPHGLLYGRVNPENAATILHDYQSGHISLANLRGRTTYMKIVQAAEYHLRMTTGDGSLQAYTFKRAIETAPNLWQILFANTKVNETYRLNLRVEDTGEQVYQGCKLDKLAPLIQYHLEDFEMVELKA